jgi:hypothetical protein
MGEIMDILKFNSGWCGKDGLVYAGRPSKPRYVKGQLLVGLGNPFSWKKSKYVKGQVKNLAEALATYRLWLNKLITHLEKGTAKSLETWEKDYLKKVLALSQAIKEGRVKGIVCWCTDKKGYIPKRGLADKECHAEILYSACCWLIESNLVPQAAVVDSETKERINIFDLW